MTPVTEPDPGAETVEVRLGAYRPPVTPPVFEVADVAYVVEDTPVGRILLGRTDAGALVASRFVADDDAEAALVDRLGRTLGPRVLRLPRALDEARRQLDGYLAGRLRAFSLPTSLALATPFQRAVLGALGESVPYGARTTYGELARLVKRPSASRAVGAALGANPLCVVLPCHRVVGSDGSPTGYAGGLAAKEYLLALEARS